MEWNTYLECFNWVTLSYVVLSYIDQENPRFQHQFVLFPRDELLGDVKVEYNKLQSGYKPALHFPSASIEL